MRRKILWWLLGLLLVAPVVALIAIGSLTLAGEEFSPDDFSSRSFHYYQIPLVQIPLSKIHYTNTTGLFQQSLLRDGWIPPLNRNPQRWDLLFDNQTDEFSADCDARLLWTYLQIQDAQAKSVWFAFNLDHPQKAKVFWPIVAQLARDSLYVGLSPIMDLGLLGPQLDDDEFVERLLGLAATEYWIQARRAQQQSRWADAKRCVETSLRYADLPGAQALLLDVSARIPGAEASDQPAATNPVGGDIPEAQEPDKN